MDRRFCNPARNIILWLRKHVEKNGKLFVNNEMNDKG